MALLETGDTYTSTVTVTDPTTGNPVDPGAVTCTITLPDNTTTPVTPVRSATGVYGISYVITQSGQHLIRWAGTGPSFAQNDVFSATANPGFMISLAEARKGVGFEAANTLSDDDLRGFIAAATPIMEDIIGSINPTTRVETHDGGARSVCLLYPPVISVTSVIESMGTAYQRTLTEQNLFTGGGSDAFGYSLDYTNGILTRRSGGVAISFLGGTRNIQVTYVSGRVLTGNQMMAARRLIRHLWQTEQGNYTPNQFSPDAMGTTPSGYVVPHAVIELCAASVRAPGLA